VRKEGELSMKKDLLSILDLSKEEILHLFEEAEYLRNLLRKGSAYQPLRGKTLGMLFRKPSNRTRLSFEVGMYQLGGHPIFISSQEVQPGQRESIEDVARVVSRYIDGIVIRTFDHDEIVKFAASATIPVINGLTDLLHPCQALSDYYTLWRKERKLEGLNLTYIGDGNNVCHSLILGAAKLGVNITVCTPPDYEPNEKIVEEGKKINPQLISFVPDPSEAVKKADVIYTDVWASMGKEAEKEKRKKIFRPYQVNASLLSRAKEDVLIMHCLPAHRGEEITDEVMDGKGSIVFEQAENRLHLQKAILVELMRVKSEE